jgi:hypothetical protein
MPRNSLSRAFSTQVLSAIVLAAALTMAGCAPAATKTDATKTGSAKTGSTVTDAAKTRAARDHADVMVYSINSDGPDFRAIVTGAVGDYGPAVTVHPDGQVDPEHTSELRLELTHGSFRLGIASINQQISSAYRHWPANASTCSGSISVTAAAPIVAGSGTGSYRGISGSFNLRVTIDEVDVKPVCDGTSKFLSQVILMTGSGTIAF